MGRSLRITFEVVDGFGDDEEYTVQRYEAVYPMPSKKAAVSVAGQTADLTFDTVQEIVKTYGE